MAKLISQSCGESQLAVCLSREDRAIWRTLEHSWMFDKPQKQATAKAAWATFSSNTWLNSKLMYTAIIWWWKVCLAVVCVEAGFSQIQSHIKYALWQYNYIFYEFKVVRDPYIKYCASVHICISVIYPTLDGSLWLTCPDPNSADS